MRDLEGIWLRLPSVPLAQLDRYRVTYAASSKCGGIRAGRNGRWIVGAFANPPSVRNWIDEVVLEDFVVFSPDRPDGFRTVYQSGVAMLGEAAFRESHLFRLPLPIYRSPLDWLRVAGAGVCPIDMPAFGRAVIGTSVRLVAEDLQHGEQLDRAIRTAVRFAYPEIQVAA